MYIYMSGPLEWYTWLQAIQQMLVTNGIEVYGPSASNVSYTSSVSINDWGYAVKSNMNALHTCLH